MIRLTAAAIFLALLGRTAPAEPRDRGSIDMFDGRSLAGWDGAPAVWSVESGVIVDRSTLTHASGVTLLSWCGGTPADFDLFLDLRFAGGGNSGVRYRSRLQRYPDPARLAAASGSDRPPPPGGGRIAGLFSPTFERWNMRGYQFDVDFGTLGAPYEGGGGTVRGFLAKPGQVLRLREGGADVLSLLAPPRAGPATGHPLRIVARGNTLLHLVDGRLVAAVLDGDRAHARARGLIGIRPESTGDAAVYVRDVQLRVLRTSDQG